MKCQYSMLHNLEEERRGIVCPMKFLLCLIGLLLIAEGLPYFAFPDKMKDWMTKIQEVPDSHLRVMGFVAMCAGLLIVYLFR